MLSRRFSCLGRSRHIVPRSRTMVSYSPKVRAYPFQVSPKDALDKCVVSDRVIGTLEWLVETVTPENLVPVYFPAWLIDTELEGRVSFTNSGSKSPSNLKVTAVSWNSYLPGHTMEKLSMIPLLSKELNHERPIPFTNDLRTQHGRQVVCLPFETSPFHCLDAANTMSYEGSRVSDSTRLHSVQPNIWAAYPVLLPLYLAQFRLENQETVQTAVIEAFAADGRILLERSSRKIPADEEEIYKSVISRARVTLDRFGDFPMLTGLLNRFEAEKTNPSAQDRLDSQNWLYLQGSPTHFSNIKTVTCETSFTETKLSELAVLSRWIDRKLDPESLQMLAKSSWNWDDLRIRPFVAEEVSAVRDFIECGQTRAVAFAASEAASEDAELRAEAERCDSERNQSVPGWWREWQQGQEAKSGDT
ncbi:unnamed protein product [Mycena citricolor]|uniref:Uncharacterized protein n=1 Tax=Mycena citricolor TaxID=2018698 RepID=A0AAD2I0H8_9AGAR|nr:unnamed protein product [Mycena citricolor]